MSDSLPEQGRPWHELAAEMAALKRDDLDWRRGRHAAYVWHASDEVEHVARQAYALFMTENGLGAPRAFPSLRRMEGDVVAMVRGLLRGGTEVQGQLTSGGTESIFVAAHAAREWGRRHRPDVSAPEIVASWSAHPAIDKAAHYLGMRVVRVPWRVDFRADVPAMAAAITPRTVMLYGSAPAYSLGLIDPIADLGALALERDLWLHVDACVGGVLAPFVRDLGYAMPAFDFTVPGVASISADLHKSGYTAKGASALLFRDADRQACSRYSFDDWPTGLYSTLTLAGTRPGGASAAAWAVMNFLGAEGYRGIARTVMNTRQRLADGLDRLGHGLHLLGEPELYAVAYGSESVDMLAVADALSARGWWPGRVREPRGIHLMITPVHAPVIDEYVDDLAAAVVTVLAKGADSLGARSDVTDRDVASPRYN